MKNIKKSYVIQPIIKEIQIEDNPILLRFILNEEYTRVDFGYAAPWIYDKGGWIHIASSTYIKEI